MNFDKDINKILYGLRKSFFIISNYIRNFSNIKYSEIKNIYPELFKDDTFQTTNSSGDNVAILDLITNYEMKKILSEIPCIRMMISEEDEDIIYVNKSGKYIVAFDPLDGSSNIDVNITVGTIFGIYLADLDGGEEIMYSGRDILASGYCLYGGSTQFVYAKSGLPGIQMETLIDNKWNTTLQNYIMPDKGKIYAINESNRKRWETNRWDNLINEFTNLGYTARWVGSLVADTHRTL